MSLTSAAAAAKTWIPWSCPESETEYYNLTAPSTTYYVIPQLFSPLLPYPTDRTYGRGTLPRSPAEGRIQDEFKFRWGTVLLEGEKGGKIAYSVWIPNEKDNGKDLVFCHGINDYGGKFSEHAKTFLDQGYRVIVPDLPSHGRSFGIHCHLKDMSILADAVYTVIKDVQRHDFMTSSDLRKTFVAGQSLGGYVAVLTCIKYGNSSTTEASLSDDKSSTPPLPLISGGLFLCPMLAISANSRPSYAIELVAKTLSTFASSLPLATAIKGKVSEDPTVEVQFFQDPMTYHGKLRISTGLAILKALTSMEPLMKDLKVPFSIHHGTGDRVTSHIGSEKLFNDCSSMDKKLNLYEGFEHILLRRGRDPEDDSRRQKVLGNMLDWLNRH